MRILTIVLVVAGAFHATTSAQPAQRFEILITEIFADPAPAIGLPGSEYVEIRNVSSRTINIKDWKLGDANSFGTIAINFNLPADSAIILCTSSAIPAFTSLAMAVAVSNFPSLDNEGDLISLTSKEGTTIHAVRYEKSWFKNDLKSNGGWSLEMIDAKNPCAGFTNWMASVSPIGGTPGKINSVNGKNADDRPPGLLRTYSIDSLTVIAVFDEPVDSVSASQVTKYALNKEPVKPVTAVAVAPLFTEVVMKFAVPLMKEIIYQLTVSGISDCMGNLIQASNIAKAGSPSSTVAMDLVINEVLFNPKRDGYDFIEIYNNSKKIIDLKTVSVGSKGSSGNISDISQVSENSLLFFPGEFLALTENVGWLKQNFMIRHSNNVCEISSLPSMPDDKGNILIMDAHGKVVDELQYDSKWHFALLTDNEGISLERIRYRDPTQTKENWTSSASTAGFGTPGYENSQFNTDSQMQGIIAISPKLFSPDNDGLDDFATINLQLTAAGYIANISIFDANGRPVRKLINNATTGLQAVWRWDGLDDKSSRLPIGVYIIVTEIFNLQGKTKRFKNVVTLVRKLS